MHDNSTGRTSHAVSRQLISDSGTHFLQHGHSQLPGEGFMGQSGSSQLDEHIPPLIHSESMGQAQGRFTLL